MAARVWVKWLVPSLGLVLACGASKGSGADPDPPELGAGTSNGSSSSSGGSTPSKPPVGTPTQGGVSQGPSMPTGGKAPLPLPMTGGAGPGPDAGGASEAPEPAPGIRVLVGQSELHESFGTVQAQLVLTAQPLANVEVALASSEPTQAAVFPLQVTFTPEDWSKPQNVFVSGVKDLSADGDQQVIIETLPAVSEDARYADINPADFEVTVIDDTLAGVVVGPVSGNTSESGGTATFSVVLTSKPSAKVVIPLASDDTTEGTVPLELSFEPEAWSEPHTVTITGVDDMLSDGGQAYDIALGPTVSDDPRYEGIPLAPLRLINVDDE